MLEALWNWVLLTSFYGSVVGAVLLLAKGLLGNKITPRWHYALWGILMLKLVMPYGPESQLSFFNLFVQEEGLERLESIGEGVKEVEGTNSEEGAYEEVLSGQITPKNIVQQGKIQQEQTYFKQTQARLFKSWEWGKVLMTIWIFGVLVVGGSFILSYRKFCKGLKDAYLNQGTSIEEILIGCKKQLHIKKELPIIIQQSISSPALIGIWYPKILLSETILKLSKEEIQYILLHELAHYKRKDTWINFLLLSFQILHWFNPILFYCFKCIRQDMELCADDLVIRHLDEARYKDYGKTLIKVLELTRAPHSVKGVLTMASDKQSFQKRIHHIVEYTWFKKYKKQVVLMGALCLAGLSAMLLTSMKQPQNTYLERLEEKVEHAWRYKTPYVGQVHQVVGLIDENVYAQWRSEIELQTEQQPYGITAFYDWSEMAIPDELVQNTFYKNAVLVFALVDNVDEVTYCLVRNKDESQDYRLHYTREEVEKLWGQNLCDFGRSKEALTSLMYKLDIRLLASPTIEEKDLNQVIGIRLDTRMIGIDTLIQLETEEGSFIADTVYKEGSLYSEGQWVNKGESYVTLAGAAVYWNPIQENGQLWQGKENKIKMKVMTQEGELIGQAETKITYENGIYKTHNPLPENAVKGQPKAELEMQVEERSFEGEVVELVPGKEGMVKLKLKGRGVANLTIKAEEVDQYDIEVGDLVQILIRHEDIYSKVQKVIHLSPKERDVYHDIGIEYAKLKGYEALCEDMNIPFGDYHLQVKDIYGDTTRIVLNLEVEGIKEVNHNNDLRLEVVDEKDRISVVTRANNDRPSVAVELHSNKHAWEDETMLLNVQLKEQDKVLEEAIVKLPLSKDKLKEGKYFTDGVTSYIEDGILTLEGIWIDPTIMEMQIKSHIQGKQVEGLYKPTLIGDKQGIYNQQPNISVSKLDSGFSQYIIPSTYVDENKYLVVKAEGYIYSIEKPEPITLNLKDSYPKYYKQGDKMLLIQNVYYENGMLHIIFGKDQPIYSLNSAQIGDESKFVGMTVQGEEENQEKIYIIHTSYKESYDITLNIDWIATEPINMSIDLE